MSKASFFCCIFASESGCRACILGRSINFCTCLQNHPKIWSLHAVTLPETTPSEIMCMPSMLKHPLISMSLSFIVHVSNTSL